MAAELSGRARACFDLKRTTFPLFSLVLRTTDLAELREAFQARLGDIPELFDQDLLVLNLAGVQREENDLDFVELLTLLRGYGLQPIGVHGGSEAQMAAAAQAGLVQTPEVSVASSMARAEGRTLATTPPEAGAASADAEPAGEDVGAEAGSGAADAAPSTPAVEPAESPRAAATDATAASGEAAAATADSEEAEEAAATHRNTVLIDKPLRAGQRVYAQNADLVMLGIVNFGAEILADGNIHVYAPLRGRAIAGARGNVEARIFTTELDPQLVAIAGVYRTIETALPENVAGKPAQIRRVGNKLLIEPL